MSEYVMMPKTDYQNACNYIRSLSGKTDLIKSGDLKTEIESVVGSGSSADVRYVTFMNGDEVLYIKPVAVGDDCVNVYTKGLIDKPTKESTVQYNYSYSGWSLTADGSADSTALQAVDEDRTVYAAFTASTRYYTITYYDGESVLKTESLAYGAMPAYTPEKSGYSFDSWEPALDVVTSNASYYAQWIEKVTFAGGTWADIADICAAGNAADYFAVGDEKTITTASGWTGKVRIVGINHDDLSDGSGKAPLSIVAFKVYATPYSFSEWTGWADSSLRTYVNSTVYDDLPSELRTIIKQVNKISDTGYGATTTETTQDKMWVPSFTELGGTSSDVSNVLDGQGTKYAYYTSKTNRAAYAQNTNSIFGSYWTRSYVTNSYGKVNVVGSANLSASGGFYVVSYNTGTSGVVFGFCI